MNAVLTFLEENRLRLGLEALGDPSGWSCVLATPRFRASSHVIFFVLREGDRKPLLVAKVPRLPGDHARLQREAENLYAGFHARPGGFDSIPQVLAYEEYCGHRLLLETVVEGQPLKPAWVRRQPARALEAVMAWLLEFHLATARPARAQIEWFTPLIEDLVLRLRKQLPPGAEEEKLLARSLEYLHPLRALELPLVLSHEDLSHPNILISREGKIGIVDWELAEPRGLPGLDLFFFLNYLAFARRAASRESEYVAAFHEAFFGTGAWARPQVARYQEVLRLPEASLRPLFLLCWLRYLAGLMSRLHEEGGAPQALEPDTLRWLRQNRYYLLWRHTLEHAQELGFGI